MDYEQIEKLIDKVNKSKITELSVEEGNFKLNIKAEQSVAMAALTVPGNLPDANVETIRTVGVNENEGQSDDLEEIKSPLVGTFYAARAEGEEPFIKVGDKIKKGQTIGIIGGTGSGKTSVVNLIPRLYDATRGTVYVDGQDVKTYDPKQLRSKVGIVPQKAVLFAGTIRENLLWGNENATEEQLERALEISQAKEFVDTKEGRLDFKIAQGGKNLSGGQRQRMTIARAVVRDPEILILDDSASALDFATDAKLRHAIREMGNDMVVIIVSQRSSSIQYADQIIVLDDGKMVGIGTHDSLLAENEVYQEIYYSQFPKEAAGNEK